MAGQPGNRPENRTHERISDDGKTLSVLHDGKDVPFPKSDRGKLIAAVVEDKVSRAPDTRELSNSGSGGECVTAYSTR